MLDHIERAEDIGDLLSIFYFTHAVYDNGLGEVEIFSIAEGHDIYAKIAQFLPDLLGNAAFATAIENFNANILDDLGGVGHDIRCRLWFPKGFCRKDQTGDDKAAREPITSVSC